MEEHVFKMLGSCQFQRWVQEWKAFWRGVKSFCIMAISYQIALPIHDGVSETSEIGAYPK